MPAFRWSPSPSAYDRVFLAVGNAEAQGVQLSLCEYQVAACFGFLEGVRVEGCGHAEAARFVVFILMLAGEVPGVEVVRLAGFVCVHDQQAPAYRVAVSGFPVRGHGHGVVYDSERLQAACEATAGYILPGAGCCRGAATLEGCLGLLNECRQPVGCALA